MSTDVSNVTSHFPVAENGFTTTTSGTVSAGATTVGLNSVAGYDNGDTAVFVIDPSNADKKQTFTGIIDTTGVQVTGVVWTAGTNVTHTAGATVVDYETATHWSMVSKGILVEHHQDGTHGDITPDSITSLGTVEATAFTVTGKTTGILGDIVTFTGSGTWTKDANLKFIEIEVQGAGGGGGGSGATDARIGAGGAGGGYGRKKIAAASLGATETVTIGAAGAAGTATGNGGDGGDSSFGAHVVAAGGDGGTVGSNSTTINGPTGATSASGDINIQGQDGGAGGAQDGNGTVNRNGFGGDSQYGRGGSRTPGSTTPGLDGRGYGAGGAGGSRNSTTSQVGGAGTAGLIIVREFY